MERFNADKQAWEITIGQALLRLEDTEGVLAFIGNLNWMMEKGVMDYAGASNCLNCLMEEISGEPEQ